MISREEQQERDDQMNELALKIADVVEGEQLDDIAFACCAVIGFALQDMQPDHRARAQPLVYRFLARMIGSYGREHERHR